VSFLCVRKLASVPIRAHLELKVAGFRSSFRRMEHHVGHGRRSMRSAALGLLCSAGLLACHPQTLTLSEQVDATEKTSSLYDALFGGPEKERASSRYIPPAQGSDLADEIVEQ